MVQLSGIGDGRLLAFHESSAKDFLYPYPKYSPDYDSSDLHYRLMERTLDFEVSIICLCCGTNDSYDLSVCYTVGTCTLCFIVEKNTLFTSCCSTGIICLCGKYQHQGSKLCQIFYNKWCCGMCQVPSSVDIIYEWMLIRVKT